ncbi:MAG: carbamoyltransferase HypF [candidate division KSB1 bacterium]|jgi:hydrogenase maturation protein HypF|nr:carbamoyltransferase HypF [candidate division KSB1 bacterium]
MTKIYRSKATVKGIVQGIGFRPFIYNLAAECGLNGYVLNNGQGVVLEVEGNRPAIDRFFSAIENHPPPLAHITSIERESLPPVHDSEFIIKKSSANEIKKTLISPDICVCADCLQEMFDTNDRRYRYPFINCTNCGPRYTIISDIPYDRPNTSMHAFPMCDACAEEYRDPENRRFHAQPNACPVCGPHVTLCDANGKAMEKDDPIAASIELIRSGRIVAIKGLGGFHLAVNATDAAAVTRLRKRKMREEKPLALMSKSVDAIRDYAELTQAEEELLQSPQRPIVLLRKKVPNSIAHQVSPGNNYFGVMLPYTPLHYLLMENDLAAWVMTSGNLSDEPIAIENEEAFRRLGQIADYFLIHDRDIYLRSDDSIVRVLHDDNRLIRRSRGYVPVPVFLNKSYPNVLALGAELKNTVCLTSAEYAFMSQHIGDLKNLESYEFLHLTISHLQRILDIQPDIIAHDLHPDYLSTRLADELECPRKIGVQHHHAHVMSCLTENNIEEPVIGLALDGTGYGSDGNIWGGEVLLVDGADFSRLAYVNYVPMPGGDIVIEQPWRMSVSYLHDLYGRDLTELDIPFIRSMDRDKLKILLQMIELNTNCPLTSSLGRLFDAVSALTGICGHGAFEGQPAIALEMAISESGDACYQYAWDYDGRSRVIQTKAILKGIVDDVQNGIDTGVISHKFHLTLVRLFTELCVELRGCTGINSIALSGGVFQNAFLFNSLKSALEKDKFVVYSHSKVPTNDGGISLGQAAVAACKTMK